MYRKCNFGWRVLIHFWYKLDLHKLRRKRLATRSGTIDIDACYDQAGE